MPTSIDAAAPPNDSMPAPTTSPANAKRPPPPQQTNTKTRTNGSTIVLSPSTTASSSIDNGTMEAETVEPYEPDEPNEPNEPDITIAFDSNYKEDGTSGSTGIILGRYLHHFDKEGISTDDISYMTIMPLWYHQDNMPNLAVGSIMSRPDKKHGSIYPFIRCLYDGARKFLGQDNFRDAKIFVLTAGLFEQCRMTEVKNVMSFFAPSSFTSYEDMKQTFPFMYRAYTNSTSRQTIQSYLLENLNWKVRVSEIMRAEPIIHIYLQNKDEVGSRKITLNPLTTFQYLLYSDRYSNGGAKNYPSESLQVAVSHRGELMGVTYLPYALQRSLSIVGIRDQYQLIVQDVECTSNSINRFMIPTTTACCDASFKHWLDNEFRYFDDEMIKNVDSGDDSSLLLTKVAKFWSMEGTGRKRFLSADTQLSSSFISEGNDDDGIEGICYGNARGRLLKNNRTIMDRDNKIEAKAYLLTAGLLEQGQFSDISKVLEIYLTSQSIDEELMKRSHKWLHATYVATKSTEALNSYLLRLDIAAQRIKVRDESNCLNLRFYHSQEKQFHKIKANPFVTLQATLGIHTHTTKFSYRHLRIMMDDGREISFGPNRGKTLQEIGIKNEDVLNLVDWEGQKIVLPIVSNDASNNEFMKEFMERMLNLVNHDVKNALDDMRPEVSQALGENGSILAAIARCFFNLEAHKLIGADLIGADQMDKFQGCCRPYDELYQMVMDFLNVRMFFRAKVVALITAFIEQCQITGVQQTVAYFLSQEFSTTALSLREKLETSMPICYSRCLVAEESETLLKYVQELDIYNHCNELRGKEPRIVVLFANRANGIDSSYMASMNSHVCFHHFVKKFAVLKHGQTLQSLRISYNGKLVFPSTVGKKSLRQLKMKENDMVIVEEASHNGTSRRNKQIKSGKINNKKKKKGGAKQKNKPREQQIVIPKTEEELRKEHSTMMTPILDQLESEKLRKIRLKLNNLSIKKTGAKERRTSSKEKEVGDQPVFTPFTEGLAGKAGKVVLPVIVGNEQHLYKSSKKTASGHRNRTVSVLDLHGCTTQEAIDKLNDKLQHWTEIAMKEETFTIPVDIVCGGGNQILSEVVEQWIRKNRQVANRPKGLI